MQACDTLINAAWCIPVEPADAVLADYSVVLSEGRIVDLLPAIDARQKYNPGATVERPGHVLIPGLVNTHGHSAMTLVAASYLAA